MTTAARRILPSWQSSSGLTQTDQRVDGNGSDDKNNDGLGVVVFISHNQAMRRREFCRARWWTPKKFCEEKGKDPGAHQKRNESRWREQIRRHWRELPPRINNSITVVPELAATDQLKVPSRQNSRNLISFSPARCPSVPDRSNVFLSTRIPSTNRKRNDRSDNSSL